jgi:hypothetical protein
VDERIAAARPNTFHGLVDWLLMSNVLGMSPLGDKRATWAKRPVVAIAPSRIATEAVVEPGKDEQVHPQHVSRKRRRAQLRKHAVMTLSDKVARQEAPGSIAEYGDEVQHPPA